MIFSRHATYPKIRKDTGKDTFPAKIPLSGFTRVSSKKILFAAESPSSFQTQNALNVPYTIHHKALRVLKALHVSETDLNLSRQKEKLENTWCV